MNSRTIQAFLIAVALPASLLARTETDSKIEDAAKASYNYTKILDESVSVKSEDGYVTLTGTAEDSYDRELAEDTVSNLPGVIAVKNEVTIKASYPEHSDAWIAFKIRSQLLVKGNVSAANTTVDVKDGVVTLSGTADNLAQKELTEVYAKEVEWVKSVDNNMVVSAQPPTSETMGEKIDDASITGQVKYALLTHGATSALKTKVVTSDGIVSVTGEAGSDAEKTLVSKLAQEVRGVKSVTNDMTVKS